MADLDAVVLNWVVGRRTGSLTWLANHVMAAGTSFVLLTVVGLAVSAYLVVAAGWPSAVTVVAAAIVALGLSIVLKQLIGRPRPPSDLALVHPGGFSMPSTDGALSVAVCLTLFLALPPLGTVVRRLVAALLLVVVAVVGFCMIYLAAHWFTDVLAGWLVGGLVAWGCSAAIRALTGMASLRQGSVGRTSPRTTS
jgi:membrane-associated phospholipid phosphatase